MTADPLAWLMALPDPPPGHHLWVRGACGPDCLHLVGSPYHAHASPTAGWHLHAYGHDLPYSGGPTLAHARTLAELLADLGLELHDRCPDGWRMCFHPPAGSPVAHLHVATRWRALTGGGRTVTLDTLADAAHWLVDVASGRNASRGEDGGPAT